MRAIAIPFTLALLFLPVPVLAQTEDLEEKVLQIIREHPEVIIESVKAYEAKQRQAKQRATLQQLKPQALLGESPTKGSNANKILLVKFSDFECSFCAKATQDVQQILAQHGDQVTFVYKHFPLTAIHQQAQSAAQAAWAAQQQGKFWEYHDSLFAQQDQLGEALYVDIAQQLGLKMKRFNRDRNSPEAAAAIQADLALGQKIGVNQTPFFILNGQVLQLPLDPNSIEKLLTAPKDSQVSQP